MSCDDAAAKTPQKRGAAEGVHTSPPRAGSAGRGRVPKSGRGGGGGGRAWRRARARHKGFRARRRSARAGGGTIFGARGMGEEPRELRGTRRAHSRRPPTRARTVSDRHTAHRPARPPSPARSPSRARPPASSPLALSRPRPASILDRRLQPPRCCRRIPPISRPPPLSPPPVLTSAAHPGAAGRGPSFPPKVSGVLFPMWGGCYGVVAGGSGAGAAPSTELQS